MEHMHRGSLRQVYQADPFVRFLSAHPVLSGILVHVGGFWVLLVANAASGALNMQSPRRCDLPFLSIPFDWLATPILLPAAYWALGNYYPSIFHGVRSLAQEGILNDALVQEVFRGWKRRQLAHGFLLAVRIILPVCFFFMMWMTMPQWVPSGKTTWFLGARGTPNALGYLLLGLSSANCWFGGAFLVDTVRFALLHRWMVRQSREAKDWGRIRFIPHHPDGAFGFGPLAPSMNWAGILGLLVLVMIGIAIVGDQAIAANIEGYFVNPMLVLNTFTCLGFFPWCVVGPVLPFVVYLFQRNQNYIAHLRTRILPPAPAQSPGTSDFEQIWKEWDSLSKGRPHIMEKQSVFLLVGSMLLTQVARISQLLLAAAEVTLK